MTSVSPPSRFDGDMKRTYDNLQCELDIEKERLKSVHHWMNNNFQLMMSMSSMIRRSSECKAALVRLDVCIYAISLVHAQVSQGAQLTSIAICPVIKMIGYHLRYLFPMHDLRMRLDGDDHICMTASKATIFCIVTALLLVDACQRGIESDNELSLHVCMQSDCNQLSLTITDNGAPLPDDYALVDLTGLGFKLITGMVSHQLQGTAMARSASGCTQVELRLPGCC